jgi:putative heme-binding domain-containing protein
MHKIVRCVLEPSGATYKTTDSDFLVSDNTDFHPTDVFEDADGSILVVDTGGWYKLCCPTSQLYKPDVLGGIYRIRRKGAPKMKDSRRWQTNSMDDLIANAVGSTDPVVLLRNMPVSGGYPFVWRRFFDELAKRGPAAVPLLSAILTNRSYRSEARVSAVWSLTKINGESAREAVRSLIPDRAPQTKKITHVGQPDYVPDIPVIRAALNSVSAHRDSGAFGKLTNLVTRAPDNLRRSAAEALGRIGDPHAVAALLNSTADWQPLFARPSIISSRSFEPNFLHSITYALIEIADAKTTAAGLNSENDLAQRASLIALDQMPGGNLKSEQVTALLSSTNALLKQTASWIIERHADWGTSLASFFEERLNAPALDTERAELQQQLERFARNAAIQELLLNAVSGDNRPAQVVALRALAKSAVKEMPAGWIAPLTNSLQQSDPRLLAAAISIVRAFPPPKTNTAALSAALVALAERADSAPAIRVAAAAAVPGGIRQLSEPLYSRLLATLAADGAVNERADAATALARTRLNNSRLLELAAYMQRVGPMELPRLLPAFAHSTNEAVGLKLIDSLLASKAVQSLRAENLKPAITNFPARVQQRANELLASLNTDAAQQKTHIDEILVSAKSGDIRRGQAIFNSPKAACSACHAIGYLGGKVGPDLTRIGQVRNERDLLEAIVYPSASFVRSYEPVVVATKSGEEFSGVLRKDAPDEVTLATGPDTEQRIARTDISDMRPGSVSVMPSGLADQLTKAEVADLLAFLKATR